MHVHVHVYTIPINAVVNRGKFNEPCSSYLHVHVAANSKINMPAFMYEKYM